jgi:hypothetical protein
MGKCYFKSYFLSWALVTHTCNPSYVGGWDREDRGSKPAQMNTSWDYLQNNQSKTDMDGWLKQ